MANNLIEQQPALGSSQSATELAADVLASLGSLGLKLVVAESLTGGLLAAEIVSIPGASDVFLGGIIAYQNELKAHWLEVNSDLLASHGAVDPMVATQMARGVRKGAAAAMNLAEDQVVSISTTGVAGPDSHNDKPAGLVFIAICGPGLERVIECQFAGNRSQIRAQTVHRALYLLREEISNFSGSGSE